MREKHKVERTEVNVLLVKKTGYEKAKLGGKTNEGKGSTYKNHIPYSESLRAKNIRKMKVRRTDEGMEDRDEKDLGDIVGGESWGKINGEKTSGCLKVDSTFER